MYQLYIKAIALPYIFDTNDIEEIVWYLTCHRKEAIDTIDKLHSINNKYNMYFYSNTDNILLARADDEIEIEIVEIKLISIAGKIELYQKFSEIQNMLNCSLDISDELTALNPKRSNFHDFFTSLIQTDQELAFKLIKEWHELQD